MIGVTEKMCNIQYFSLSCFFLNYLLVLYSMSVLDLELQFIKVIVDTSHTGFSVSQHPELNSPISSHLNS